MFCSGYDKEALSLVAIMTDKESGPAEYGKLVVAMQALGEEARAQEGMVANIMMVVEGGGPPDAKHRRALADASDRIPAFRFSFVTRLAVARAITAAIHWLSPANEGVERVTHANTEDSIAWFEQRSPGTGTLMRALLARARRAAT